MNILLTGFDPFGGESTNPSWEAVRGFNQQKIAGNLIHCLQLPTEFGKASAILTAAIQAMKPELCFCVGQAGGRALISLEKVAINFRHARIYDNAGMQPEHQVIDEHLPAAYFANFDFVAALQGLNAAGIPAEMSYSAGAFVCNEVFFALCQLQALNLKLRGCFIHIPYAPEQVVHKPGQPSMARETVINALNILIETGVRGHE